LVHSGACKAGDACAKCAAEAAAPVCCGGKTSFKNACYARCNGADAATCKPGRCNSLAGVDTGLACLDGACAIKW
jgi:hypothetical protein